MELLLVTTILLVIVTVTLLVLAITIKPVRKAIGLVFIILGIIECLSFVGLILGIPSILLGGILLFA